MILDVIAESTAARVARNKVKRPLESMVMPKAAPSFYGAITGGAIIAEIKQASPSEGIITDDFIPLEIAQDYKRGGAAAISVLAEPEYFFGGDDIVSSVAASVNIPVLYKDFVIDEYQLFEAKSCGAAAVLLIAALYDGKAKSFKLMHDRAREIGLDVLTETHDEREIDFALEAGATVVGINCRNLKDFTLDFVGAVSLLKRVPTSVKRVLESAVRTRADVVRAVDCGADGVLVGTSLMRASSRVQALKELRGVKS